MDKVLAFVKEHWKAITGIAIILVAFIVGAVIF